APGGGRRARPWPRSPRRPERRGRLWQKSLPPPSSLPRSVAEEGTEPGRGPLSPTGRSAGGRAASPPRLRWRPEPQEEGGEPADSILQSLKSIIYHSKTHIHFSAIDYTSELNTLF
uniref:Uncharacterized protein n=1 Tax=Terrapene triunguis TaxID=2587831 RepID=A0A674IFY3_9SAUR